MTGNDGLDENVKQEIGQSTIAYKANNEFILNFNKAAAEFALWCCKTLIIVNSGAVFTLVGFVFPINAVETISNVDMSILMTAIYIFAWGTGSAAIATMGGYLTNYYQAKCLGHLQVTITYPYLNHTTLSLKFAERGKLCLAVSFLAVVISYGFFVFGIYTLPLALN